MKKSAALARRSAAAKTRTPAKVTPDRRELADAAAAYAGARAENTKRAYTNDFVAFSAWCGEQGLPAMPALPGFVALYLTALAVAEKKVATRDGGGTGAGAGHRRASGDGDRTRPGRHQPGAQAARVRLPSQGARGH